MRRALPLNRREKEKPVAEAESDLAGACAGQIRFCRSGGPTAAVGGKKKNSRRDLSGATRAEVICSPGRRRRTGEQITGARRAERNKASLRRPVAKADWRRFFGWSLRKAENLRKEADAGQAGSGEPYHCGETFPLHQVPAKRRPGSKRYGERADLHGASGDAQGELCSPPLHSRRGKTTDEAGKGRTQARSIWSERRYRA